MFVRLSWLCLAVVGLVGCATEKPATPYKSALTYEQHLLMGDGLVMAHKCAVAGFMDVDSAAYLRSKSQEVLQHSYYLQHLLDEGIKKATERVAQKDYCVRLAMAAADSKRQESSRQQVPITNNVPGYTPPIVTKPIHTYCNRLGSQVTCSSF